MQKFIDISQIHKAKEIGRGSEAIVHELSDPDYVYKEYLDNINPSILRSKMLNISALMDINDLYKYGNPTDYMVADEKNNPDKLLGVIMGHDYSESISLFKNNKRIIALLTLKDMLEGLKKLRVKYFDLLPDNIRHNGNPKDLLLSDMDGAYVDGIESDYGDYDAINYYLKIGGKPDFNAVTYIFNYLTYSFLTESPFFDDKELKYYDGILTKKNLNTHRINSFCKSMFSSKVDQIADHDYLINIIAEEITVSNNKFVLIK
jgi:hypothetical protein